MSYWYLASPYSHPDPQVVESRFASAVDIVIKILGNGDAVYSPIVHWHTPAKMYGLPQHNSFWANSNKIMLQNSKGVLLYKLPGWKKSEGIKQELEWADEFDLQVRTIIEAHELQNK